MRRPAVRIVKINTKFHRSNTRSVHDRLSDCSCLFLILFYFIFLRTCSVEYKQTEKSCYGNAAVNSDFSENHNRKCQWQNSKILQDGWTRHFRLVISFSSPWEFFLRFINCNHEVRPRSWPSVENWLVQNLQERHRKCLRKTTNCTACVIYSF